MITLTGKKVSEGIVIGRLVFFNRGEREIRKIYVEDAEKELVRFQKARKKTAAEIRELYEESASELGEANATIFEMQQMVLDDEEFVNRVVRIITDQKLNAEYAVKESVEDFLKVFSARPESYVRGHEADVQDVASRVLRILSRSRKDRMFMDEPFIMAARNTGSV